MTGQSVRRADEAPLPSERIVIKGEGVNFPVVALEASTGGLDTFKKFFDSLPADCGMAFVLIQHLDPAQQSQMDDVLAAQSAMKVLPASDGIHLERNHVYLIPPGAYVAIEDGALCLSKPLEQHGARIPFDFFQRSLAEECGERAVSAVLSALGQTWDTAELSALRETAATRVASLTMRQRQILDLVLEGHPSKSIAASLGISQRTVDNHRAAIMRKTGSKSLPALIRTALTAA